MLRPSPTPSPDLPPGTPLPGDAGAAPPPRRTAGRAPGRTWPYYLGGFAGPFGAVVIVPMLDDIAASLGTDRATAALGITAYMVPFAVFLLYSGTLAERWGRRRTVRAGFVAFALCSAVLALASHPALFLAARAVQGTANAFTTPVLLAALSDQTPPQRLGRTMGAFGAAQAFGNASGTLGGGIIALVHWRFGFVVFMVVGLLLAQVPPPDAPPRQAGTAPARLRSVLSVPLLLASASMFFCQMAGIGTVVLSAEAALVWFDLGSLGRGLVSSAYGMAGLVGGLALARATDRIGPWVAGALTAAVLAVGLGVAAAAPNALVLALGGALGGMAFTACRAAAGTIAAGSSGSNRSGAMSVLMCAMFLGGSLAPVLWLPAFERWDRWGFGAVGAAAVLGSLAFVAGGYRRHLERQPPVTVPAA